MKLTDLRRRDRPRFLERVQTALADSRGVIEPAARALGTTPRVLHRWLCEPELRSTPVKGKWREANDEHLGVRVVAPGDRICTIDAGIVPMIEATWSLAPFSPETRCSR